MSQESPFMPTKPYWVRNESEIAALRAKASELTARLRGLESNDASWIERQRVRSELDSVQRELHMAEVERDRERRRRQGHNAVPASNETRMLNVLNRAAELLAAWHAPKSPKAGNAKPVSEAPFAATVPYFER